MGRMHSKGKGKSRSALPYKRTPPSWLKLTSQEVRLCFQLSIFNDENCDGRTEWKTKHMLTVLITNSEN